MLPPCSSSQECQALAINLLCKAHHWSPTLTTNVVGFASTFNDMPSFSLDDIDLFGTVLLAVGLLPVADLLIAARWTITRGHASLLDAFTICAGMHKDYYAPALSMGEYPACAAMTTNYVFRIENEAMVYYMQRMGRTGQLTTLEVTSASEPDVKYWIAVSFTSLTICMLGRLVQIKDWPGVVMLCVYALVRFVNAAVLRRRAVQGWKGKAEPGVKSDLLVLLSQDRWIRLKGMTDDVKVVTSGAWLRQSSLFESLLTTISTLTLYLNAGLAMAASREAKVLLLLLVCGTTLILEVLCHVSKSLELNGRTIRPSGKRQVYERRLDMAAQLIEETGQSKWCEKMGITLSSGSSDGSGPAHM